jgi:hypothetical protein
MKDLLFLVAVFLIIIYAFSQPSQQAEVNKHMKAIYDVLQQTFSGFPVE